MQALVNTFPFRLNDSFLVLLFGVEIPSGNEHVCFVIIRSNSTQREAIHHPYRGSQTNCIATHMRPSIGPSELGGGGQ